MTDRDAAGPETTRELLALMPFAVTLGIELDAASAAEVRGRLAWSPERCTAGGILHGGVLMALADSLGGICAYLNLPAGRADRHHQLQQRVPARHHGRGGHGRGPAAARRAGRDRGPDGSDR